MALNKTFSFLLFGIFPLILIFALETQYRGPLYEKTLNDVPAMQKKKRIYNFMFNVSFLAEFIIPPLALIGVYNLVNKLSSVYIWSSIAFAVYLNILLKSFYS
jgi:nitrate reductase NapE component